MVDTVNRTWVESSYAVDMNSGGTSLKEQGLHLNLYFLVKHYKHLKIKLNNYQE